MKVLLTGASGFVGSHVLRHLLVNTDWQIVCPVTFQHKGLSARMASSMCDQPGWNSRVQVIHWDLRSPADAMTLRAVHGSSVIMNVASESHVDRSIAEPGSFIRNNTDLIINVLELARKTKPRLVLHMSTDEVYGPAYQDHRHKEWEPVIPSNPYSASKAAQEAIAISYWRTYGVPVVLTNTMNIIGEMQDPEKFLPMIIRNLYANRPVKVHTGRGGIAGSRFYLHARNLADAWLYLTRHFMNEYDVSTVAGPPMYAQGVTRPSRWHIVGEREVHNDELVRMVGGIMGLSPALVDDLIQPVDFHSTRPGHDPRYALDGDKIDRHGWKPPVPLDEALARTVHWTLAHPEWLEL
jgi:dTDP-glucose 4,6-dehydratase